MPYLEPNSWGPSRVMADDECGRFLFLGQKKAMNFADVKSWGIYPVYTIYMARNYERSPRNI